LGNGRKGRWKQGWESREAFFTKRTKPRRTQVRTHVLRGKGEKGGPSCRTIKKIKKDKAGRERKPKGT